MRCRRSRLVEAPVDRGRSLPLINAAALYLRQLSSTPRAYYESGSGRGKRGRNSHEPRWLRSWTEGPAKLTLDRPLSPEARPRAPIWLRAWSIAKPEGRAKLFPYWRGGGALTRNLATIGSRAVPGAPGSTPPRRDARFPEARASYENPEARQSGDESLARSGRSRNA
jgi:hypothetical protein